MKKAGEWKGLRAGAGGLEGESTGVVGEKCPSKEKMRRVWGKYLAEEEQVWESKGKAERMEINREESNHENEKKKKKEKKVIYIKFIISRWKIKMDSIIYSKRFLHTQVFKILKVYEEVR